MGAAICGNVDHSRVPRRECLASAAVGGGGGEGAVRQQRRWPAAAPAAAWAAGWMRGPVGPDDQLAASRFDAQCLGAARNGDGQPCRRGACSTSSVMCSSRRTLQHSHCNAGCQASMCYSGMLLALPPVAGRLPCGWLPPCGDVRMVPTSCRAACCCPAGHAGGGPGG